MNLEFNNLVLTYMFYSSNHCLPLSLDLNAEAGYDTVSTTDDILDFTERNPFGEVDE